MIPMCPSHRPSQLAMLLRQSRHQKMRLSPRRRPKPPNDSLSFESEPPTLSLQRPTQLSSSPADRATGTIYSAITKNVNDALILSPYLVHNPHPYPSQLHNGPKQPDEREPGIKPPLKVCIEPKPPSMPPDDFHVSKPLAKPAGDVVALKPPS